MGEKAIAVQDIKNNCDAVVTNRERVETQKSARGSKLLGDANFFDNNSPKETTLVVLRESYQNAGAYVQYTQLSRDLEYRDTWLSRPRGSKRIRRKPKQLTVDALAEVAAAYGAGATLRELTQLYEINRERLALIIKSTGYDLRPRGPKGETHPRDALGRYLPNRS